MNTPIFPAWTNQLRPVLALALLGGPLYLVTLVGYGASPKTTDVGYAPEQPIPFSHRLHAGELGLDCRYCHTSVESATFAAVPPTQTCMNCHARTEDVAAGRAGPAVRSLSEKLAPLYEHHTNGTPVPWVKVHDLPDYVYFNHAAHVGSGVSCVSCHGRVDRMDRVVQQQPLSMGWCLECHRNPEPHLRPVDKVTDLGWTPEDPDALGKELKAKNNINPSTDCSTCHR